MREVLCYTKVFIPFLFSVPCQPVCKSEAIGRGIAISIVKILNLYIILLANLGNSKQKMTNSGGFQKIQWKTTKMVSKF